MTAFLFQPVSRLCSTLLQDLNRFSNAETKGGVVQRFSPNLGREKARAKRASDFPPLRHLDDDGFPPVGTYLQRDDHLYCTVDYRGEHKIEKYKDSYLTSARVQERRFSSPIWPRSCRSFLKIPAANEDDEPAYVEQVVKLDGREVIGSQRCRRALLSLASTCDVFE